MRPAFAALLLAATTAQADAPRPQPKNIVVADLGLHVVGLGYQRVLNGYVAGQFSVNLWLPWTMNQNFLGLAGTDDEGDLAGFVGRVRVFLYPEGRAPIGAWVSPFLQYGLAQQHHRGALLQGPVVAAGCAIGWAWLFFERIHLALGLGAQYHAGPVFGRLSAHADINLGFAF